LINKPVEDVKFLDCQVVWKKCLECVKTAVPTQTFNTWFLPLKPISVDKDNFYIQVPNKFFFDWIDTHYGDLLQKAIYDTIGNGIKIQYTVMLSDDNLEQTPLDFPVSEIKEDIGTDTKAGLIEKGAKINENYIFEKFVEGSSNQFAKAAAVAVANAPGKTSFNPLVIYGGVGLGKTHLLQAVGNEALKNGRARKVIYISSDTFTMEFIEAIQKNKVEDFTKYYKTADILLVDDIQFFQNKVKTQENFFNLFNSLYQHHHQVVLTSDTQPMDLNGLQDRLLSRFQSGLIVDIQPPDLETRIAILRLKAEQDNLEIPYEIIEFIAENICSNVRELEGAMIRLLAYSSLLNVDIDIELAKKVLREIQGSKRQSIISVENIQNVICSSYNINLDLLIGKNRRKEIAEARMIAMYFTREYTNLSLKTIGLYFGGRDHSTVVHACKWVESKIDSDLKFSDNISSLKSRIESTV
jgi:chromosomal replication initiator protein